jgi:hypothetical protein
MLGIKDKAGAAHFDADIHVTALAKFAHRSCRLKISLARRF